MLAPMAARGRKERLYRTPQGRWPPELRVAGIATLAAADQWLRDSVIARFTRRFCLPPAGTESACSSEGPRDRCRTNHLGQLDVLTTSPHR